MNHNKFKLLPIMIPYMKKVISLKIFDKGDVNKPMIGLFWLNKDNSAEIKAFIDGRIMSFTWGNYTFEHWDKLYYFTEDLSATTIPQSILPKIPT